MLNEDLCVSARADNINFLAIYMGETKWDYNTDTRHKRRFLNQQFHSN